MKKLNIGNLSGVLASLNEFSAASKAMQIHNEAISPIMSSISNREMIINMVLATKRSMAEAMVASQYDFKKLSSMSSSYFKDIVDEMQIQSNSLFKDTMGLFTNYCNELYNKPLSSIYSVHDVINQFNDLTSTYKDEFDSDTVVPFEKEDYTDEDYEQINNAVEEVLDAPPENFQTVIKNKVEEFKEKQYLAYVMIMVLKNIFWVIIVPMLLGTSQKAVTKTPSAIKEDVGNKVANAIIPANTEISIINSQPYYYEILYNNEETGEVVIRYIAKKNVKLIENNGSAGK